MTCASCAFIANFSSVPIVDFEQVNISRVITKTVLRAKAEALLYEPATATAQQNNSHFDWQNL